VAGAAQLSGRVDARAPVLLRRVVVVVEAVGRNLDQGRTGRGTHRLAEGEANVDGDRRPVEDSLGELGERAADLRAVRFLEGAELVLGGGVLPGEANDGAAGQAGDAEARDGLG